MPVLTADRVAAVLAKGATCRRELDLPPRFQPGERVLARNINPLGHTRIPRYVRGRCGVIDRLHGVFVFPDSHAADGTEQPQHVYSVRFAARELWGPDAPVNDYVYVDLWDAYLEPA